MLTQELRCERTGTLSAVSARDGAEEAPKLVCGEEGEEGQGTCFINLWRGVVWWWCVVEGQVAEGAVLRRRTHCPHGGGDGGGHIRPLDLLDCRLT